MFREPLEITQDILDNPNILFKRFEDARLDLNKVYQVQNDTTDMNQYVNEIKSQNSSAQRNDSTAGVDYEKLQQGFNTGLDYYKQNRSQSIADICQKMHEYSVNAENKDIDTWICKTLVERML